MNFINKNTDNYLLRCGSVSSIQETNYYIYLKICIIFMILNQSLYSPFENWYNLLFSYLWIFIFWYIFSDFLCITPPNMFPISGIINMVNRKEGSAIVNILELVMMIILLKEMKKTMNETWMMTHTMKMN